MTQFFAVMAGGALGAGARYWLSGRMLHWLGPHFAWGTLSVNILGSLLMGVLFAVLARTGAAPEWRAFLAVGLLGGFTTFSAFSLDVWTLIERKQMDLAVLYIASSVGLALGGLVLGLLIGRQVGP